MAFMKIRKSDGTLLDLLFFKGDKGDKGDSAKFSYGDTLPDTMEDGEVFFKTDGADYIVEQGTSGIWTYRKWNSGIAECWGSTTASGVINTAWGGIYEASGVIAARIDYPFEFTEVPVCDFFPTGTTDATQQYFLAITPEGGSTTTQTPEVEVLRGAASTVSVTYGIGYRAIGRWK